MAGTLAIRRLRLAALAPRGHPAPHDLENRLRNAVRTWLAPALIQTLQGRSDPSVLRIRRLAVDVTLDTAFDPEAFAALLAGAIAAALLRLADTGDNAEIRTFPNGAAYLAELIEALGTGRAATSWWLRDADGLRFLPVAVAIRTALLADPTEAQDALSSLPPGRLATVLAALGPRESERVLDALAAASPTPGSAEAAIAAVITAAAAAPNEPSPLAMYLQACATPGFGGRAAALVARLWTRLTAALDGQTPEIVSAWLETFVAGNAASDTDPSTGGSPIGSAPPDAVRIAVVEGLALPKADRIALAKALERCVSGHSHAPFAQAPHRTPTLSRFAGLLLLVPGLPMAAVDARVAEWDRPSADAAALIAYATLGLCAGRRRFAAWLRDPLWRELFGLDTRAATLAERLGAITDAQWHALTPIGLPLDSMREARFLLPPRALLRPHDRAAARALAALARLVSAAFARRLIGLRTASAPFLWENVVGAGGVFERGSNGWHARLSRPPLDVLLSLSRMSEGSVLLPGGAVRISRVTP